MRSYKYPSYGTTQGPLLKYPPYVCQSEPGQYCGLRLTSAEARAVGETMYPAVGDALQLCQHKSTLISPLSGMQTLSKDKLVEVTQGRVALLSNLERNLQTKGISHQFETSTRNCLELCHLLNLSFLKLNEAE